MAVRACPWLPAALLLATLGLPRRVAGVLDVAVVGAGPAGLALASALMRRGLAVRVFEKRDTLAPTGSAVFLWPFGVGALRAVDARLCESLLAEATVIERIRYNSVAFSLRGAEAALGAPFVALRFADIVRILRAPLPEGAVALSHGVRRYVQLEEGGVELHFDRQPACRARYLVDAGGIGSAVRRQLRADRPIKLARAVYAVSEAAGAAAPAVAAGRGPEAPPARRVAGELGFDVYRSTGLVTATLGDGAIWWTQTRFAPDAVDLPAFREGGSRVSVQMGELPLSWTWGRADATLIGDAAHAATPALGLGISSAFEDVAELVARIDAAAARGDAEGGGLSRQTLREYEDSRKLGCAVRQLASRGAYRISELLARITPEPSAEAAV